MMYFACKAYQLNLSNTKPSLTRYNNHYILLVVFLVFFNTIVFSFDMDIHSFKIMNNKFYPQLQQGEKVMTRQHGVDYKVGSFVIFMQSNLSMFGRILAVGPTLYHSPDNMIDVPKNYVLVDIKGGKTKLIPNDYIMRKVLYVFWSKHFSKIGTQFL